MLRSLVLGSALIAVAACGDDKPKSPDADQLVTAWRAAKLEVSPLTEVDAKTYAAVSCRGGTVSGVDVVVCTYGSGEDAQAAQDIGLTAVGEVTGAALAKGTRLLVVMDRRKVDPSGRTIDAITTAFRK